ncbi:MAG TPA: GerMN domain-containing protein [Candidatus Acidoferrum sp.]|nr:GerMN domain-containing protein [Candidatus Acidoferrum sp.]
MTDPTIDSLTELAPGPAREKWKFWLTALLVFIVVGAAISVPIIRSRMKRAARLQQQTEEQARRELTQSVPMNPADPHVKAKLFWVSDSDNSVLAPVTVELPLSGDPVLRSKQVLNTLLAGPVDVELRTLPPDAVLLAFYILPDGTAIADFSEALATSIPSGIASEQLAVDSLAQTLAANVPEVKRLKILIHGQEAETLAGHVDLTGTFVVHADAGPAPASPPAAPSASKVGALVVPPLTARNSTVKLAQR